jgi:hypothetical protein
LGAVGDEGAWVLEEDCFGVVWVYYHCVYDVCDVDAVYPLLCIFGLSQYIRFVLLRNRVNMRDNINNPIIHVKKLSIKLGKLLKPI